MKYLFWLVLFILLTIRVIFFYQTRPTYPDGTKIRITDRVSSEPIYYDDSLYLKLQGFKVYLPRYPEVYYGDNVIVEGVVRGEKLREVKLIERQQGKGFLYNFRKRLLAFYQSALPQPHSSLVAGVTIGSKSDIGNEFWENLKSTIEIEWKAR